MESCFNGIYRGRKVLVTGHTGFKGAWLSLFLRELGAEVLGLGLDPPPTIPSLFDSIRLKDKIIHVVADIRDEEKVFSVLKDFQPEIVFHLAAQPIVRLSYKEPKLTYETNVMGTINLLEAIRKMNSVRAVINITTDKCYENQEWLYGYREIDRLGGKDPYSSSKACAELVTASYRSSFFSPDKYDEHRLAISSARAGNVIGGGDWAEDRLIPDCIKSISQNKSILIRSPKAIRPWQYVLDPLSGYLSLGALMYQNESQYNGAWNFGPSDEKIFSVEQIVSLIIKQWGKGHYTVDVADHPYEAKYLKLDCSKARTYLGWKEVYDIQKSIEETVRWYREFYENSSASQMYDLSLKQIMEYIEDAKGKGMVWSITGKK